VPMEVGKFLHLAIGIAVALGKLHERGLVHKDIKPANILVNRTTERRSSPASASPLVDGASSRRRTLLRPSPAL
jgi:serine/threonine protein kinase